MTDLERCLEREICVIDWICEQRRRGVCYTLRGKYGFGEAEVEVRCAVSIPASLMCSQGMPINFCRDSSISSVRKEILNIFTVLSLHGTSY